ncbi:MAG TPA: Ohr family peroxiredoxin [Alloiococcus sp.]|nr:Ohr family peroxiredoxin [Alloiococcus sp.]
MSNYEKIYSTTGVNESGRDGRSYIEGGDFEVEISSPGKNKPGTTNPEQLFALGYSACYNSALDAVKADENVDGKAVVRHHVDLLKKPDEVDFKLAVLIEVGIEGMDPAEVQPLADKAHTVCPYSKAVKNGDIDVEVKAVAFEDTK